MGKEIRGGLMCKGLALLLLPAMLVLSAVTHAAQPPIAPWMMADWENPAPHFADMGIAPRTMAASIGKRLVVLPQPRRDIAIPGPKGLRAFPQARFVSAIAVVDLPAQTLRRRIQDFSGYKNLFPLLTQSEVMKLDGPNVVARYRVEVPLPAFGSFAVDFRIKHALEADGSISALLVDGKAESLIAMLGGATDELADQPVLARWEFLPLDATHSLLVFTYWDRVELKSFFARKVMEAYPELKVVGPYMVAVSAAEAIHRLFTSAVPVSTEQAPQGMESLNKMKDLFERFSRNGQVAVLEPEQMVTIKPKVPPLRYASVVSRIQATPAQARDLSTRYQRLPDALKELELHSVTDRGNKQVDLDLTIRIAILLIRFSIDLDVQTLFTADNRLEFRRTAGELAQLWGAAEWYPVAEPAESLMLVSAGHEVGDDAPLFVRMAHKLVDRLPYIDQLGSLIVQMVAMERLKPWMEKQVAPPAKTAARE